MRIRSQIAPANAPRNAAGATNAESAIPRTRVSSAKNATAVSQPISEAASGGSVSDGVGVSVCSCQNAIAWIAAPMPSSATPARCAIVARRPRPNTAASAASRYETAVAMWSAWAKGVLTRYFAGRGRCRSFASCSATRPASFTISNMR